MVAGESYLSYVDTDELSLSINRLSEIPLASSLGLVKVNPYFNDLLKGKRMCSLHF